MNVNFLKKFRKTETILLGILLYGIVLVYTYQYFKIANKYEPWTTDEWFYYTEAKAISAHNFYKTPASFDGNTSYIGDFGSHGISYALKDGWLAKLFFQAEDPPMVWINFLTCMSMLALILLYKPFSLNTRLKIALVVATHYVLYQYTLTYMQETIQFLFAILALRILYLLYNGSHKSTNKYLYYYLILLIITITFRASWFIWGLGLLPLATNFKDFTKWMLVVIGLTAFGILITRYTCAPYPYLAVVSNRLVGTEHLSLLDSLTIIWQKFTQNLQLFLTPDKWLVTTCMRYLLLALLLVNTWYAITKRNKFTIACTLIGWAYLVACLAFYLVLWGADERGLAVLNPLLAFSLIGNCNSFVFYPVIILQLWLFPNVVETRNQTYLSYSSVDVSSAELISKEASYSKIKDLVTDNQRVAIAISPELTIHGSPKYHVDLPLVTKKGYPIHYIIFVTGNDLRKIHHPQYILASQKINDERHKLIYSDRWMHFYRILH